MKLTKIATAAAALMIAAPVANAQGLALQDTGIPGKPTAGIGCTKFPIGSHVWAFNTSDPSMNGPGRLAIVNDAYLNRSTVVVSTFTQVVGPNDFAFDTVICHGDMGVAGPTPLPTPSQVQTQ